MVPPNARLPQRKAKRMTHGPHPATHSTQGIPQGLPAQRRQRPLTTQTLSHSQASKICHQHRTVRSARSTQPRSLPTTPPNYKHPQHLAPLPMRGTKEVFRQPNWEGWESLRVSRPLWLRRSTPTPQPCRRYRRALPCRTAVSVATPATSQQQARPRLSHVIRSRRMTGLMPCRAWHWPGMTRPPSPHLHPPCSQRQVRCPVTCTHNISYWHLA